MNTNAVVQVAIPPSPHEIEVRFESLYPEIESRARRMSRRFRDPEECQAESVAFMWLDFANAARDGKWLAPSRLAHYAALRLRSGRKLTDNSFRDAMSSQSQVRRHFCVLPFPARHPKPRRANEVPAADQFIEAIPVTRREDTLDRIATKLDMQVFLSRQPQRVVKILALLVEGYRRIDAARVVGLSPGRVSQVLDAVERDLLDFLDAGIRQRPAPTTCAGPSSRSSGLRARCA